MDIVKESLGKDYNLNIISTYPNVVYQLNLTDGSWIEVDNPLKLRYISTIDEIEEPMLITKIHISNESIWLYSCIDHWKMQNMLKYRNFRWFSYDN